MDKIKNNRVIGARGIGVVNGNLNSGFDGRPKSLTNGCLTNSDVSTKFLDRELWKNSGENVLITKKLKVDTDGTLYACTLSTIIDDLKHLEDRLLTTILNDYVDVQNFGVLIPVSGSNVGFTGVCQYTQGINKLKNTTVVTQPLLSPFSAADNNKNKKKSKNNTTENTLGTNVGNYSFIDKALYVQSFAVNPTNLNNLISVFGKDKFVGYKESSYQKFKKATLCSASLYNTRTKTGCYDEFSIFINLKENSLYSISDIGRFIDVIENEDSTVTIDFTKLEFLNDVADIESIEIYYNILTCKIKHTFTNVTIKDLLSCY